MQKKILYKTLYFVFLFNGYDLMRQGPYLGNFCWMFPELLFFCASVCIILLLTIKYLYLSSQQSLDTLFLIFSYVRHFSLRHKVFRHLCHSLCFFVIFRFAISLSLFPIRYFPVRYFFFRPF